GPFPTPPHLSTSTTSSGPLGSASRLLHRPESLRERSPKRLIPADQRPHPPQKIEADLEDILGFLDVDWKPKGASKAGYWSADEVVRVGAKVVIVVLGKASDPVGECVLSADAERPTATGVAHCSD